jgi:hypothetical protein
MKKTITLLTIALLGIGTVAVNAQDSTHVAKTVVHTHKHVRTHTYTAHHTAVTHSNTNADGTHHYTSKHVSVRKDSAPGHVHTTRHVVKRTVNQ